ncbi:MAG TPA: pyridoxal phosphate-dependent aminotransferase, partial [Rhizobiales bacterium]|nr:pyridoxal phosphate-dependent aminotransferase [Hyphomicrobiales bacterium]
MTGPRYTQLVESLPASVPFVGPETQERQRGRAFAARIGANENVFGPSPKAIEAMCAAARGVWQYGDPENHDLKEALAAHHSVSPANIVIGEGIDGLLGYLARMLVTPGTPVVTSIGAYPTFNYHVNGFGGEITSAPYRDDHEDMDALLELARKSGAPLIYLANPDNPMGSWHEAGAVAAMIDAVPDGALLCLDEAYIEFAPEGTAPAIDVSNEKVIRFRTFSKAYGMAGARIGYGIAAPGLIGAFNKVRNHFGVNLLAQVGAMAALDDEAWLNDVLGKVFAARKRLAEIARQNGLSCLPSATNFVAIDTGRDGDYAR